MDCEEECCICLNEFQKETKKTLTCGHELCIFCLNRMVVSKCPLCRDPIDLYKISKFNIGVKSKSTDRRVRVMIIHRHVHNNRVNFFMNLLFIIRSFFNC